MFDYKKLMGNTIIFAIGNMGSRIINILLVPLYTFYLSTDEYGSIDLITVTVSMLLPVFSLSIYNGVLRFTMDKGFDNEEVITNGLVITVVGSVVAAVILFPLLYQIDSFKEYIGSFYILLILNLFQSLFAQFTRAIGKIKEYSINGILTTFVTASLSVLFLAEFHMGVRGYLLASIIGIALSNTYLFITTNFHRYFFTNKIKISTMVHMIKYSAPLIPNSLSLWVTNSLNRYFILYFIGASGNGLFAVANKIPNIISVMYLVFSQALQLSVIEVYEKGSQTRIFGSVFDKFASLMLIGTSGILIFLRFVFGFLVSPDFYAAWNYVPFLLLAALFSSFSGFLGTIYIGAKNTNGVFRTSIIGAIINILLNFLLVPILGINGAGISSMVSYLVIWILRIMDTNKLANFHFKVKRVVPSLFIIMLQIVLLYTVSNDTTQLSLSILLFLICMYINRNIFTKNLMN